MQYQAALRRDDVEAATGAVGGADRPPIGRPRRPAIQRLTQQPGLEAEHHHGRILGTPILTHRPGQRRHVRHLAGHRPRQHAQHGEIVRPLVQQHPATGLRRVLAPATHHPALF